MIGADENANVQDGEYKMAVESRERRQIFGRSRRLVLSHSVYNYVGL